MSALDWNMNLEPVADAPTYTILPDGEYQFTVTAIEKGWHEAKPGGKIDSCPKAEISIRIETPEGNASLRERLYLHTATVGVIAAFFASIGITGQARWDIEGLTGRARVKSREYNGATYNVVARWIPATAEAPTPAPPAAPKVHKMTEF